jgi:SAM-dependent methyltransferase
MTAGGAAGTWAGKARRFVLEQHCIPWSVRRAFGRRFGPRRLNSRITQFDYLMLRGLQVALERVIRRDLGEPFGVLLDIGTQTAPYRPLFGEAAKRYVALDIAPAPGVSVAGTGERLPLRSDTVDVALCTQVLEHVEDPRACVDEMRRVLRKDGVCLLSTHGIWNRHEVPADNWRFTRSSFFLLFREFSEVEVINIGGSALCLFQFLNLYARQARHSPLARPFLPAIYTANNLLGWWLGRTAGEDFLTINYLVVARK